MNGWGTTGVAAVRARRRPACAEQDLRTTVAEDVRLVESVQRGLESGGYRPAPLIVDPAGGVNSEHSIRVLYEWLGEAMA